MFTAHSSPNINIKDFLLTIRNSVFPLKIQEISVWFTKPRSTVKQEMKNMIKSTIAEEKLTVQVEHLGGNKDTNTQVVVCGMTEEKSLSGEANL